MSVGAALGGWTAANVGYRAAFIVKRRLVLWFSAIGLANP